MSTYCISDLHGHLDLWNKMNKELFKEDDIIYCLGDSTDRGPEPWETFKIIYCDPRVKYILGNHEDMLVNAGREMLYGDYYDYNAEDLLYHNGGYNTFRQWYEENDKEEWLEKIQEIPYFINYYNKNMQNIWLTHAGFTPTHIPTTKESLWNRKHYSLEEDKTIDNWDNGYVIHGHTNKRYIAIRRGDTVSLGQPYWYADGHKCCIDAGTARSKSAIVLNLDTFESHYFTLK